jgi:hypothetical protein
MLEVDICIRNPDCITLAAIIRAPQGRDYDHSSAYLSRVEWGIVGISTLYFHGWRSCIWDLHALVPTSSGKRESHWAVNEGLRSGKVIYS